MIFGARAGQHGNVGRMRAPRDDLASWSSTCHHARLVVTFYESTTTGGYDGTRVTSFTRCYNCLRFRKTSLFSIFSISVVLFIFSQLQFTRRGYEEFPKRKIKRESKLILSGSKGFDGFWGKFLFDEIRGRGGFNRAISLEVTRGGCL